MLYTCNKKKFYYINDLATVMFDIIYIQFIYKGYLFPVNSTVWSYGELGNSQWVQVSRGVSW